MLDNILLHVYFLFSVPSLPVDATVIYANTSLEDVQNAIVVTGAALNLAAQEEKFNFNLTANMPASTTTSVTTLRALPENCGAYNVPGGECTDGMTATNVTFDDCGDPWTVCRCSNANMTMDTVVDQLGRVPVGLRRYVATVVVLGDTSTHAYTLTNGDIHLFGDSAIETGLHEVRTRVSSFCYGITEYVEQSMHSFDFASGTSVSSSSKWLDAIGNDSCAPDGYSLTNAVEVPSISHLVLPSAGFRTGWRDKIIFPGLLRRVTVWVGTRVHEEPTGIHGCPAFV
ncbi:hypothetical protein DFS33DRAFT_1368039 [Desarmillaria ectypa]|nr:hypothetical protein DFS33DRAFT_1368039 [Desarmillaria ectypa]